MSSKQRLCDREQDVFELILSMLGQHLLAMSLNESVVERLMSNRSEVSSPLPLQTLCSTGHQGS